MSVASPASCAGIPSSGSSGARCGASGPQASARSGAWRRHCAQHLRDRVVRLGHGRPRGTGVGGEARLRERVGGEPRLADAGLAGDEHAAAAPSRTAAQAASNAASSLSPAIIARFSSMPRV